jgi:hypothetical protein
VKRRAAAAANLFPDDESPGCGGAIRIAAMNP